MPILCYYCLIPNINAANLNTYPNSTPTPNPCTNPIGGPALLPVPRPGTQRDLFPYYPLLFPSYPLTPLFVYYPLLVPYYSLTMP